jgi:hypothetical protein
MGGPIAGESHTLERLNPTALGEQIAESDGAHLQAAPRTFVTKSTVTFGRLSRLTDSRTGIRRITFQCYDWPWRRVRFESGRDVHEQLAGEAQFECVEIN